MERREEAETYHPAVHTQRRQQIVRTLDEVLRVPLIAQHHVLRGSLAFRLRRRLASRNTPSVVRFVCRRGGRHTVTRIPLLRDEQLDHGRLGLVRIHGLIELLHTNPVLLRPLAKLSQLEALQLRHQRRL